ncbi:MAG: GTPase Era [Candidatus Poribacteria bacterium]|nr:GTPase Era [Candidatus Poribacteria bacterium]
MTDVSPDDIAPETPADFRAGYVGIVGRPNAGKSTLLNALVGQKLAAVTRKPQTTRTRISGVLTTDAAQYVFLDTPGIIEPRYRLQEHMVRAAYESAKGADLVLYMIDAIRAPHDADDAIIERLGQYELPMFLLLNKVDKMNKLDLLPLIAHYAERNVFAEIVPVSAQNKIGLPALLDTMTGYLPQSQLLFPADTLTELPERFFIAETVREKVLIKTRQEVPYASSVVVEEYTAEPGMNRTFLRVAIYVERPSQKAIIIGKGGSMLKVIGTDARKEIEEFIGGPVFLELFVGIRENWRDRDNQIREFGYDAT